MTERQKLYIYPEYDDFTRLPENRDRRLELINGEIVEKVPSFTHSKLASLLHGLLFIFWRGYGVGQLLIEARYKLPDDDHNAVIPDLSYIADLSDMPADARPIPRMPDLAIEIASPDDDDSALRAKAAYYLAHGARAVWLFFPKSAAVEIHRPDTAPLTLTRQDTLDGGDILPGLLLPLDEIFSE